MGRFQEYHHDRKAEVLYHLKRGPIAVQGITLYTHFGFEWGTKLSSILKKAIMYVPLKNSKNIRLEISS